jgi:hypothetical protein
LQNASSLPEKNTLARFVILTRLIQIMNVSQLDEVTKRVYTPQPSPRYQSSFSANIKFSTW